MARHGIDAALLAAADPGRDDVGATRVDIADPYSAGKARLLAWTAGALRCRALLHQVRGGRVTAVTVFGFSSDRERVELLFTSLLVQAARELGRCRPALRGESVAAYRRSWLHGFALQVHRRLAEAEDRAARPGGATGRRGGRRGGECGTDGGGAGRPPRPSGAGVRRRLPGDVAGATVVAVGLGLHGGHGSRRPGGSRRAPAPAPPAARGVTAVCGRVLVSPRAAGGPRGRARRAGGAAAEHPRRRAAGA
jgi:hypothetical protein